jgi:hypothetical protein
MPAKIFMLLIQLTLVSGVHQKEFGPLDEATCDALARKINSLENSPLTAEIWAVCFPQSE